MYRVLILCFLGLHSFISCDLLQTENAELSVDTTLQKLAILHRHGDRSPITTYTNDPYGNESYWPDGWAQLTMRGKRRLYTLGKFIRRRYSSFLTDDPGVVKVRSSGANRCLNSVQSLLAGAYPPTGRFVISPELTWQPFPVQTVPRVDDGMLNPDSHCLAASTERSRITQTPEYLEYLEKHRTLLNYLSLNTGDNIKDIISALFIRDCLFIEQEAGLPLPAWATDKVMNQLKDISDHSFYFAGMTPKIQRLRTGVFFKDLVQKFETHVEGKANAVKFVSKGINARVIANTKDKKHESVKKKDEDDSGPEKKLFLYSSHDTMVSVLLQAMNQFNMLAPPYAATLFFELHKHCFNSATLSTICSTPSSSKDFYIKIFYLNETETEVLHPILPPGCKSTVNCPLSQFTKAVELLFIDDFESECESRSYWTTLSTSVQGMCCSIHVLDHHQLIEPL